MSDFINMRLNMVNNQLKPFAVTDPKILEAFGVIPREKFSQYTNESTIYSDNIIFLHKKKKYQSRFYLSPAVFAKMIQIADIQSHENVLDIGCLTGYTSSILSMLCSKVYAIDYEQELIDIAGQNIKELGISNITFAVHALKNGYPKKAPYDVIFINGSIDFLPEDISSQIHENGRIVTISNENNIGNVVVFKKAGKFVDKINYFEISVPHISKDFSEKSTFTF
tara:strand:+ start:252 stop:923 length:672 start_codon:yes stop_codon:yes gene_type:complete